MTTFDIGQLVKVVCDVQPGPFSGEKLITVDTVHGLISGFAREDDLEITDTDTAYLRGLVTAVGDDTVTVRVRGSFFTTNGIMDFATDIPLAA